MLCLRLSALLLSGLLSMPVGGHASIPADSLDAEGVIRLAMVRSASVVGADAALSVARAELLTAGARPNPEIEFVAGSVQGAGTRTAAALMVPLGVHLDRGLRTRAARGGAAAAALDLTVARQRAAAEALGHYFRVLHARNLADLARGRVTLANRLLEAARARVRSGDAARVDEVVAEVELSRARSDALVREQAVAAATGELHVALRISTAERPRVVGDLADHARLAALLAHGPEHPGAGVLALAARVAAARAERALAGRSRWPDVALRLDYEHEDGMSAWMPGAAVTLPIFDSGRGERELAAVRLRHAEWELEAAESAARSRLEAARAARDAARAALDELEANALPRSREVEVMAEQSYRAGKADLGWLLVLRRDALATQDEYNDRLLEVALRGIDLAVASGAWPAGAEGENP